MIGHEPQLVEISRRISSGKIDSIHIFGENYDVTIEGQKDFIFQILTRQLDRRSGCRLTTTTNQDTISFSFSQSAAFHSCPSNEPPVFYKDVHNRCFGRFVLVTTLRFW